MSRSVSLRIPICVTWILLPLHCQWVGRVDRQGTQQPAKTYAVCPHFAVVDPIDVQDFLPLHGLRA